MAMVLKSKKLRVCPICGAAQEVNPEVCEEVGDAEMETFYQKHPQSRPTWVRVTCVNIFCKSVSQKRVNWKLGNRDTKDITAAKNKLLKLWRYAEVALFDTREKVKDALPLTSEQMEVSLAGYFNFRRNFIVPNISWGLGLHECDLLVVTKSGYATEVEIKISVSDMKADFAKRHHHYSSKIKNLYFAVPKALAEKILPMLPGRAGLLTVDPERNYRVDCVKPAVPQKGVSPLSSYDILKFKELGCMRIWNLKERLHKIKVREKAEGLMWFDSNGLCEKPTPGEDLLEAGES
jgi:hypothetical protein